ncbi:Concanavalin A-like lectin/glucanase, subgroup [Paramyrothecium foliicola]|nr:Concanavalin A-like lectin/glucanase, subgroup [Paramyrothecium foliicola]
MPSVNAAFVSSLLAASAFAQTVVDDSECDCYLIDGSAPTYYKDHGFWDFRSLSEHALASPPVVPDTVQGNIDADFPNAYLNWNSGFTEYWGPQNWENGNATFPNVNSYNNLYIARNEGGESDTMLTMRTARVDPDFQTSAEFESRWLNDHASMRMHARTHGSPGACTAMFTFLWADRYEDRQESDIEVLTNDPTSQIHYTNQPSYIEETDTVVPGASNQLTLPNGGTWDQWHTHRLDWTPGMTTWSFDGQETFAMAFQVPKDPSQIVFNAWSDGKPGWTGLMPVGGAAYQDIQWIEILANVTTQESCPRVCSVDLSPELGKPVRI